MTKFLLALAVVTLLVLGFGLWSGSDLPSFFYESLVLLFISTAGLFYYLLNVRETQPDYFVQVYLLIIAIKLLAYGSYLGLVIWKDQEGAALNVIFFMVVYVIFTALEVGFLWFKINR